MSYKEVFKSNESSQHQEKFCVCVCVWLSMLLQKVCSSNIRFSEFASSRWFTDPFQLALQYQQRVYIFYRCRIMYFQNTLTQFSFSTLISINYQFLQKLKLTFLVLLLYHLMVKLRLKIVKSLQILTVFVCLFSYEKNFTPCPLSSVASGASNI